VKKFVHEPNFIGLIITCTKCINVGHTGSLKNIGCEICGKYRTLSFSPFDYSDTYVDKKFITEDPLENFVDYLLYQLNINFKTICFAHNGGRYDNVILFKKLFNKHVFPSLIRKGNKLFEINQCFADPDPDQFKPDLI
jgi:hypothetical protein